jgi:glutathione S-transferase
MTSIVVHHLERSRSHRVLWLLEELEVEYALELYERDPQTLRAPPELKKLHPLGKSPIVTIDGRAYAESGAVIETLLQTVGGGRFRPPLHTDAYERYRYFLHFAEASLMPPLLVRLIMDKVKSSSPLLVRPIANAIAAGVNHSYTNPEITNLLDFLDLELEGRRFLAGDEITGADFQVSYPLAAAHARVGLGDRPNLTRYFSEMNSRPAFKRAIEKGGPLWE